MLSNVINTLSRLWNGFLGTFQTALSHPDILLILQSLLSMLTRFLLPLFALLVVVRCARSLLQGQPEPETWGWLTNSKGDLQPLRHWEILIGRSRGCDVVLPNNTVSRNHAALIRNDKGGWSLFPLPSKNPVRLNGEVMEGAQPVKNGDLIALGSVKLSFRTISAAQEAEQARLRTRPGKVFHPGVTLFVLSLFQALLCTQLLDGVAEEHKSSVLLAFGVLCLLMWIVYFIYRILHRTGFEIETLAFFLTTLSITVTADSAPGGLKKQLLAVVLGLALFFILSIVLRDLDFAKKLRWPAAAFAVGLLAFNVLLGQRLFGAKNWVSLGPISFQPSELVKVIFVLVGAATLDRMFARRNLIFTLLFSAYCVGCLALMSDFGTALVFFVAFLAIAFLRSGDLPSVAFMTAAAGFAGFIVLKFKPYIANRFAVYRHVWADPSGAGYQQTRTLSAMASGGLFGQGVGNGWLKNIGAANTDLVFGVLAEELGLIIAVLAVVVILLFAIFTIKSAASSRSSFYCIAACATAMIYLMQTMLNVFGSTDLLPLTGVTLPFVSCGGSSMMACWCLLAYIKASDTRQNAGIAVKLPKRQKNAKPMEPAEGDETDLERLLSMEPEPMPGEGESRQFTAKLSVHRIGGASRSKSGRKEEKP